MKILFIGYWGANEGLSQATINPHLTILSAFSWVDQILYVSVEREVQEEFKVPSDPKICHIPFYSRFRKVRGLNKLSDFVLLPRFAERIMKSEQIDFLICRSSLAGAIGYMVNRKTGVPYAVESFEPHALYMKEAGIWQRNSLSFRLQNYWEGRQKQTASWLMPVTELYRQKMMEEGVPAKKLITVPCAVDLNKFGFDAEARDLTRTRLGISEDQVLGIYVGKFGGIYLEGEAFQLFAHIFRELDNFFLLIISPQNSATIYVKAAAAGIVDSKMKVIQVAHAEVPDYLSAADVAFSLHSPTPSKRYVSPIKNGEYWANGLPIVMPKGIGDDSNIIEENESAGILWDDVKKVESFDVRDIKRIILGNREDNEIAKKYRDFSIVKGAYERIFFNSGLKLFHSNSEKIG